MDIPGTHIEETAGDFFAELETAAAMAKADIGRAYATVGAVFRRAADQRLLHSGIAFAGMFAKVDHLLRECGVRPPLTYYINDTRVRLRRLNDLSDAARRRHFAHDLKNVCRFVSVVCGGAPVPASLAALLPRTDPAPEHGAALAECMRVAVAAVSGTTVTATFDRKHLDCPPLGDLAGTVALLIQGNPELEVHYRHTTPQGEAELSTAELKAVLGDDISLAEPEIFTWIQTYLSEQEAQLEGAVQER